MKYNKYHNNKTEIDGITFDSKLEANRYKELKLLEKLGKIENLELQPTFELIPTFKKDKKTFRKTTYKADFKYYDKEKNKIIVEDAKGFLTEIYKLKRKLFEYTYKDLQIIEIKKWWGEKMNEILKDIEAYKTELRLAEKREKTINQYESYLLEFIKYANIESKEDIRKEDLIKYKEYMQEKHKPNTINIKITILNAFITFIGLDDSYKLKRLKKQQKATLENVLSPNDYERLLRIAQARNKITMYYLMETLAEIGIRISELKYITVEAVKKGVAVFDSKGTVERKAFINKKLQKELLKYCKEKGINSGIIFISRNGNPLDEAYIYKEIQWIARTSKS